MRCLALLWLAFAPFGILQAQNRGDVSTSRPDPGKTAKTNESEGTARPIVVSAQMKNGKLIYRVNGKTVETSPRNSLMTNLGIVLGSRGKETRVFIVIDVLAPFAEFTHIDTALDKVDLPNRRYFVSTFAKDRMMTEVHWADKAVPIPHTADKE